MSKEKAARAGVWSALDIVLRQGVQFVVSVILARLLAPADFGLIALLSFFSSLSIVFVQGGLSMALVQRQETTHEEETAVFWVNLIAGTLFALILIAIAPWVARFYGYPLMHPLMYVAAAQVVLSSLGAVQTALLTRTLRFDQLTKTGIVASLASGVAGVGAALAGWGVWALAVQLIVQAALNSAALWWVSDWRPAWRPRFGAISALYRFGFNISLSSTLDILYSNGFVLVIGKFYGARELGYLNRATTIQGLPNNIISAVIARTALPLLAARQDDKDAMLRGFRMAVCVAMLFSMPLMVGLSVLADLVVVVLLGDQWGPVAPVLAVAAIGGILLPFHVLNLQLLLARGDSTAFLKLEIEKKIVAIVCFGIGCFYGIMGIAVASVAFSIAAFFINSKPTKATLDFGVARQIADVRGIIGATIVMAAAVAGLRAVVDLPPIPLLAVLVTVGGAIYVGVGLLLRLDNFRQGLDLMRMLLARQPSRA